VTAFVTTPIDRGAFACLNKGHKWVNEIPGLILKVQNLSSLFHLSVKG
jgi:hypothetical protein